MIVASIILFCIAVIIVSTVILLSKPDVEDISNNTEFNKAVTLYLNPKTRQKAADTYGMIEDWDTSRVTNMSMAFSDEKVGARRFNADISKWDTSNVTNMERMFKGAEAFNAPIGAWDVKNVENMKGMFDGAYSFNQNIGGWNVGKVRNMRHMLRNAKKFNKDVTPWISNEDIRTDAMLAGTEYERLNAAQS